MINLNSEFNYYRDLGMIDCIDCYYLFDDILINDIIPLTNVFIEIYISHKDEIHNHVKVFINNIENSLYMDNYDSIKLIININNFIKNKKLND